MTMMPSRKGENVGTALRAVTSPFGEYTATPHAQQALALLALSHTPVEHLLYQAMLQETLAHGTRIGCFSVQHLTTLTGVKSFSTIRRGRAGLIDKLSIERQNIAEDSSQLRRLGTAFFVFSPEEIFERRRAAGLTPYPVEGRAFESNSSLGRAIERVVEQYELTRREAQVALWCAEGLTNAEIGEKLYICRQTVKFHLRHIFAKCGVKRRTELISRLLIQRE